MRRAVLFALALLLIALSCSPGFDPPSKVEALRILAVDADKPYAQPGEKVTLRMTVADGLRDANGQPRALQILWLGGCVDPDGDQYFLCFEQLAAVIGPLAAGGKLPPSDLVKLDVAAPASDGAPDAHDFTVTVPQDIVSRRPVPGAGPHYGIEYVFYAACAGKLAPAPLDKLGSTVPEFPVRCLDDDGKPQGPDSFVPGYTQIYSFEDGRRNSSPPTQAITLDGANLAETPDMATTVAPCPLSDEDRRQRGCTRKSTTGLCDEHELSAVVPDAAEVMPDGGDEKGSALREVVWVSYYADRGDVETSIKLVSDARLGFQEDHSTKWTAPDRPGLVQIWAVTRDQRGGESVRRAFVRVQ